MKFFENNGLANSIRQCKILLDMYLQEVSQGFGLIDCVVVLIVYFFSAYIHCDLVDF